MTRAAKPLVLEHVDTPERRVERELCRIAEPRLARHADDPTELARRRALADIIARAHAAWTKRGAR